MERKQLIKYLQDVGAFREDSQDRLAGIVESANKYPDRETMGIVTVKNSFVPMVTESFYLHLNSDSPVQPFEMTVLTFYKLIAPVQAVHSFFEQAELTENGVRLKLTWIPEEQRGLSNYSELVFEFSRVILMTTEELVADSSSGAGIANVTKLYSVNPVPTILHRNVYGMESDTKLILKEGKLPLPTDKETQ